MSRRVTREQLDAETLADVIARNIVALTAKPRGEMFGMRVYESPAIPADELRFYAADGTVHRIVNLA